MIKVDSPTPTPRFAATRGGALRILSAAAFATCLLAPAAFAHPGHDSGSGLSAGFLHPFLGLDHLLAMIAVGILAGQRGGRALVSLPASFIVAMIFGAYLALHSTHTLAM